MHLLSGICHGCLGKIPHYLEVSKTLILVDHKKWEIEMTNFSININLGEGWHTLHASQVDHLAGAYPGFFCRTEEYFYSWWRVSPSIKFARTHLHHWALSDTLREKCYPQSNSAPWLSGLKCGPLDPKASALTIITCASTNQECNERKLPTCVYSLVHNWANTSSLTKVMVVSFCQTSTGKCMHHPTEKKLLYWVQHSTQSIVWQQLTNQQWLKNQQQNKWLSIAE